MEEEMLKITEESSDSNYCSSNMYASHPNKRCRVERFKGVVPQQNGHWGAQIYVNHQRIWLGTFKSEIDAAMAYDSATIKLRSGESHRNFPSSNITLLETKFQTYFSTDVVLSMIRDGWYPSKFSDFLRHQQGQISSSIHHDDDDEGFSCTSLLFQKELTPSDVGKLNRLVIPKRYAVKHFPNVPESLGAQRVDQVELEFYDRQMSLWKFRYCYWKSSQSFVFTRGWNRFVKEKGLRANDTIAFYMCESQRGRHSFLVIDVACKNHHHLRINDNNAELDMGRDVDTFVEILDDSTPNNDSNKGFRLFGVQID